jgi:hypothetical protein
MRSTFLPLAIAESLRPQRVGLYDAKTPAVNPSAETLSQRWESTLPDEELH